MTLKFIALAVFSGLMLGPGLASETNSAPLAMTTPTLRATPPGAKVGAGYVIIHNTGDEEDRLLRVASDLGMMTEIHLTEMDASGTMSMREVEEGLQILPGKKAALVPGGFHIMVMGLKKQLVVGDKHQLRLTFEKAGEKSVLFEVKSIGDTLKLKEHADLEN